MTLLLLTLLFLLSFSCGNFRNCTSLLRLSILDQFVCETVNGSQFDCPMMLTLQFNGITAETRLYSIIFFPADYCCEVNHRFGLCKIVHPWHKNLLSSIEDKLAEFDSLLF